MRKCLLPWWILPVFTLSSCGRLPQAPSDLFDLGAWFFAEHPQEDPAGREQGMVKLNAWLERYGADAETGYEVAGLKSADVADLDGHSHSVQDIVGIAVATRSSHGVADHVLALMETDQEEVCPDRYLSFERAWDGNLGCFVAGFCERISSIEDVEISLPAGLESVQSTENEYVWVENEAGAALLQRSWLPMPGDLSLDVLEVRDQYYLSVVLPRGDGGWRVQVTWLVAETDLVPESSLMEMSADSMVELAQATESWMDELAAR